MSSLRTLTTVLLTLCAATTNATDGLALSSPALTDSGPLPTAYTCDGESLSPPLSWTGVPEHAKSLVFIMDHKPKPREETQAQASELRWYWVMYNAPVDVTSIDAGHSIGTLGSNVVNGQNQYAAPCSKGPGIKQYTIHFYALSDTIEFPPNTLVTEKLLREKIEPLVIEKTELSFSVEREGNHLDTASAEKKPEELKAPPRPANKDERPPEPAGRDLITPTPKESIDSEACTTIQASVEQAGFDSVSVTCDTTYAYVQSNTYPDHELMTGIVGTNEQIPVATLGYAAPILLAPQLADKRTSIDAALGIAVNGVPIYDYSAQGELDVTQYDATKDTVLLGQLDHCGGHAGRGDDYHYHAKPTCMLQTMKNVSDDSILGWAYDGYPLFGDNNPNGSVISDGELDACNGQTDSTFGYRYHTSAKPPYILQCLVGKVDTSVLPRVPPLQGSDIRANLKPPREGVQNLLHTESADGTRTLSYFYQGEEYYTRFTPSTSKAHCYDFEQKTISNGGAVENGSFCR